MKTDKPKDFKKYTKIKEERNEAGFYRREKSHLLTLRQAGSGATKGRKKITS